MKKIARKIFLALKPYTMDLYVYKFDLRQPVPDIKARIDIDIKTKEKKTLFEKRITFLAFHNGQLTNKADLIFNNLLGRQLGLGGYPVMGNAETNKTFRGKNIMGFTLVTLFDYYLKMKDKDTVYIFTSFDNFSMQSVMDKVGCEKLYRVKIKRVLGFMVNKKIINA